MHATGPPLQPLLYPTFLNLGELRPCLSSFRTLHTKSIPVSGLPSHQLPPFSQPTAMSLSSALERLSQKGPLNMTGLKDQLSQAAPRDPKARGHEVIDPQHPALSVSRTSQPCACFPVGWSLGFLLPAKAALRMRWCPIPLGRDHHASVGSEWAASAWVPAHVI